MKLRSIFITTAAALTLWTAASSAPAQTGSQVIAAARSVVWSVHFDAERLRTGGGQEFITSLDPALAAVWEEKSAANPGGKLESVTVFGFAPRPGKEKDFPLLADIRCTSEKGGLTHHFEELSKKDGAATETVAGQPVVSFKHHGRAVWIAKASDTRAYLATSRALVENALASGTDGFAAGIPQQSNEILGGSVEVKPLLANNPELRDSEVLKMLPHLEFHVAGDNGRMDLSAAADLDSDHSAQRAARLIDGVVAGVSLHDKSGIAWDERLKVKQNGSQLTMSLSLEQQEVRKLIDSAKKAKADRERDDD